ncbi:hypothetical protein N7489_008125 [Penicillium chrysogenum]|uniref:uncharacterized protein n=1 Tax=Penicillium chrysogenum TaxID=5076 RepID=UPI0024DF14AA|nr:uncharacterized protein N7489_008125 [Penicillium chrysogenum]KAJ5238034.1 hypothetical protein N7489_008125 [Penicillium chrysogenum]KAJ6159637.1 hypothetical protein N7497_004174 [Penicillium chrysogenum]
MARQKRKSKTVLKTWSQWATAARLHGVFRSSIHKRKNLDSGSKIKEEQYLPLKALWDIESPTMRAAQDLNLGDSFGQARDWLATFEPFQAYLDTIADDQTPGSSEIGVFEIPREQQRKVCELLQSRRAKGLQSLNEEIVNSSLISRASLTAEFREAHMECLLDGFLASEVTSQTEVIIEAKADRRDNHSPEVFMQEAAELVAALVTGPPKGLTKDRCLLISQDGDELYITNAYALDKYIAIMRDRDKNAITKNDFLRIRQWGAWKIDEREEIEDFARLVLAIALQSSAEN